MAYDERQWVLYMKATLQRQEQMPAPDKAKDSESTPMDSWGTTDSVLNNLFYSSTIPPQGDTPGSLSGGMDADGVRDPVSPPPVLEILQAWGRIEEQGKLRRFRKTPRSRAEADTET